MTNTEPNPDKEEDGSTCSESWGSLPTQREGSVKDVSHHQDLPEAVGSRVEQLTKMVENLTAKFVLLENHLKLTQLQTEGRGSVETGDNVNIAGKERKKEKEETLPLRDITTEMLLKQSRANSPAKQPQSSSLPKQPFSSKQVNSTSVSEAALSQREVTTPLSSVSRPEPLSEVTPLMPLRENYIHRYTSHSLNLDLATPSTPVSNITFPLNCAIIVLEIVQG